MQKASSYFLSFILIIFSLLNISCSGANFGDSPTSEALKKKGVLINEGDEYTNDLNVRLKLNGGYAQKIRISSKSDCSDGVWEDFIPAQTRNWTLPSTGNRTKHVYVKYANLDEDNPDDPEAQNPDNPELQTKCFSDSIIYDNTPPRVIVANKKISFSRSRSLEVRFYVEDSISGIDKTLCALDNGKSTLCQKAVTYRRLSETNHTVEIVTFDKAGNSSKPAFYSWSVDSTPPRVSIKSKPPLKDNQEKASFAFNIEDSFSGIDKIECALDGGAYTECSRNYSVSRLKEGSHKINVKAFDIAGNENKGTVYQWTVDQTGPVIEWVSKPNGFVNAEKPSSFTIKAKDAMSKVKTILCRLDGGSFEPCQNRFVFSHLSHGSHKVTVKALDELGNPSKEHTHTWKIDGIPPTVTIDKEKSAKAWVKRESQAKVYFSATDKDSGIDKILCSQGGDFRNAPALWFITNY